MKHLIINADDFGLHETVNLGIIQGYTTGIITSTTIMASGKAFEHAVGLAETNQKLGVGVHLTLVGEKPVCHPDQVKSLVDQDGYLSPQYPQFLKNYLLGKIQLSDIRRELTAQVKKVVDSGIQITHLDSHQHMHIVPAIMDITIDIAKDFGIKAVRIPAESHFFRGGYPCPPMRLIARSGLTMLAQLAKGKVKKNKLAMPEHFFGMLAGGNMQEEFLLTILKTLPHGISEIMMHPGSDNELLNTIYPWNYHGQEELAAVTSAKVRHCLNENRINLISFRDLK
ncbi:ChbG/HpnK family deacetylase [Pelosinus sp. sgz500959]|uniref:ChbG/HpnK family deacetylase n=1 Tax=Pelosinus sp. sgz500959 TaxID=3242472 RepID=UPI00366C3F3F